MDWSTIQNAIASWAGTATGLSVTWADQNAPRLSYPFVELNITSEDAIGQDAVVYAFDEATNKLTTNIQGNRTFVVSAKIHSLSQGPTASARYYLGLLRGSLKKAAVLAAFKTANIAFVSAEMSQTLDTVAEGRWISVGLLDLKFAASENIADTATDYIESVSGAIGSFTPGDYEISVSEPEEDD